MWKEQLPWPSSKSVCLRSCTLEFDYESGQTNDYKSVFTASLLDATHLRDSVENKPASLLVVPLGKALSGNPPSAVIE